MNGTETGKATAQAAWRYGTPAIILHWILAVLIACMVGVGWYMMEIEDQPGSGKYFDLHKSVGIIVFALVLLRIVWRLGRRPAPLPASVPGWEARLASIAQRTLYACMFLMPILGFIGASYSKEGVAFFGMKFPSWLAPDHDAAELFFSLHGALAWVLVGLVGLHVAGAFKHLFVDKDGVFRRMWF
jgi:cytochrome b561